MKAEPEVVSAAAGDAGCRDETPANGGGGEQRKRSSRSCNLNQNDTPTGGTHVHVRRCAKTHRVGPNGTSSKRAFGLVN